MSESEDEIRALFNEIDVEKRGSISKTSINAAFDRMHEESSVDKEFVKVLKSAFVESPFDAEITIEDFQQALCHVPRLQQPRENWVRTLKLEAVLAKFLKVGTLFDGLKGLREMTLQELEEASSKFCDEVHEVILQSWKKLTQDNESKGRPEDPNSKFAVCSPPGDCFGDLAGFYENPEGRLRYPLITSKKLLLDAMFREHCIRANAFTLFMASNYSLATCAEWEWRWVVDPDLEHSESLKVRMSAKDGKFPGEFGDTITETLVCFTLDADLPKAAESTVQKLENDRWYANEDKMHAVLETNEEHFRGIRVVEAAQRVGNVVTMTVAFPMNKEKITQDRLEKFRRAVALITNVLQNRVVIKSITENIFLYCALPDRRTFQSFLENLASKGLSELKSAMESEWNIPIEPYMSQETCFSLIWEKFNQETDDWEKQGKYRRQGRMRQGGYNQIMELSAVKEKVEAASLIAEEVIGLRLYTGPMHELYNAALRGFPEKVVESLSTNLFETTICVIMSGLVKLSTIAEMPSKRLLYCGVKTNALPESFWQQNSNNFQGGVEYGFLSTTAEFSNAVQSSPNRQRPIVFEIIANRIDVGASMRFISQYPYEEEFLTRPLSCLEVLVYPIRVNANLKIMTVKQLIERRKDIHQTTLKRFREELIQQLEREILYSNAVPNNAAKASNDSEQVIVAQSTAKEAFTTIPVSIPVQITIGEEDRARLEAEEKRLEEEKKAKRDAEIKAKGIRETLKAQIPILVKKIIAEVDLVFKRHTESPVDTFNNDSNFRKLVLEIIDSKQLALRKVTFFKEEIEVGGGLEDPDMQQRIISTPLQDFARPGIELALRTGVSNFPWQEVVEKRSWIDFGTWTAAGLDGWKLEIMKQKLAQNDAIRKITIKNYDILFPHGMLITSISLDGQPVKRVVDRLAFLLSINTQLTALSLREAGLGVADWNIILASLAGCTSLTVLNNCDWSTCLLAGCVTTLSLWDKEIGVDGAVVVASLLPRSSSTLTALRLGNNLLGKEGSAAIAEGLVSLKALHTLDFRFWQQFLPFRFGIDVKGNGLSVSDWRTVLDALSTCLPLSILNGYDWSEDMLAGGLPSLEFCHRISMEEAVVISALLPRSTSALTSLKFFSANLEEDGGTAISKGLRFLTVLQTLDLGFNALEEEGGAAISEGLRFTTTLLNLNLRNNNLKKGGATAIAESLRHLENLQSLDLSTNAIQKEGAAAVSEAIRRLMGLRKLDLRGNGLDVSDWKNVLGSLSNCAQLSTLNNCEWSTEMILGELTSISLWNKEINAEGAALAAALLPRSGSTLTSLDISTNSLRKEGAEFLAESFRDLSVLKVLNLGSNSLQKDGATAISAGLRHLTALESLDLRVNALEAEGGSSIADGLRYLTSIQALDLRYNGLQKDGGTAIAETLRYLPALTSLDLRSNALQKDGAMAVFHGLRNTSTLETLDLSWNACVSADFEGDTAAYVRKQLPQVKHVYM